MSALLSKITSKDLIVLVMLAGIFITGLVWTGVAIMQMLHTNRREMALAELKQELANRGMTAEQIVAVLEAGKGELKQSGC